jgi:lysophospholipase L1-like esterase
MQRRRKRQIAFRALAVLGSVLVPLGLLELALRLINYEYHLYPERIEFGFPDPETIEKWVKTDPDLFWTPLDYEEKRRSARTEGVDLIFMGCSCTQYSTYPEELAARLSRVPSAKSIRYWNAAMTGWTTYQGLQQLRRDILELKPKVVTLYFGWNDHWFGFGVEDEQVGRMNRSPLYWGRHFRVVQLLSRAYVAFLEGGRPDKPNRVPPEDFRRNLTTMVELARREGIEPILLTAPTSYEPGAEPAGLLLRHIRDLDELIPLHEQYVQIVRDVAAQTRTKICDLAQEFDRLRAAEDIYRYFLTDGVHLTEAGSRKVAEMLHRCFVDSGVQAHFLGGG